MKGKKIIGIVILLVCIAICGSVGYSIYTQAQEDIAEWKATTWFVFSNSIESFNDAEYVTKEEIQEYEVKTDIYNAGVYYSKLNEREQLVYKAYQYALDNNYVYTYVDGTMLTENDLPASDIIVLLSLDSAIVQQNMSAVEYSSSHTIGTNIYGIDVEKEVEGFIVSAETFSKQRISRVNKAIDELEKVDFEFTEQATDEEKAKAIFEYVEKNVDYAENLFANDKSVKGEAVSAASGSEDYLYSAVFKGKTNCDGFANMYSLLCQINGIQCIEKVYFSEVEGEAGHTWNSINVNGKWYNVDCTESIEEQNSPEQELKLQTATQFGFSDELQVHSHDYAEYAPVCSENLMRIDGTFAESSASGMSSKIASYVREAEDGMAVFVVYNFDEDALGDTMQSVANNLRADIRFVYYEREKCYICCVYKK